MGDSGSAAGFPFGTLCAVLAVVGLTALPFVSCTTGPPRLFALEFKGHELLRNRVPDVLPDLTKTLEAEGGSHGAKGTLPLATRDALFTGGDSWLHWAYMAAVALAVVAVFLPSPRRARGL